MNAANRFTGRYLMFRNDSPYNGSGGGTQSLDWATDFLDAMDSTAGQLVTTIGSGMLNEARVQYAHRHQSSSANADSGTGPGDHGPGRCQLRRPVQRRPDRTTTGSASSRTSLQAIDNFTYIRGSHSYKFGFDGQWVHDERTSAPVQQYTFPTVAAYQAAKSGANPLAYSSFTQLFGNLSFQMDTSLYSTFVQDDWQIAPNLKLVYGVRYDLYQYPDANADAPFSYSQKFNIDKNNWGPRAGLAWTLDDRTVVRASTGLMYDQPILSAYENALQLTGSPQLVSVNVNPTSAGAPAFPGNLAVTPPGFVLPTQSIVTVDPAFQVAKTWQNNVQIERAVGQNHSDHGRLHLRQAEPVADGERHQSHQPHRAARRRPADFQHRGQCLDPARPALQSHLRGAVERQRPLQRAVADAQPALGDRGDLQPVVHARQGRSTTRRSTTPFRAAPGCR